jgi:hypothetical protein
MTRGLLRGERERQGSFTAVRKDAGLCCGSRLRKGEVFPYVGLPQNLKDLKDLKGVRRDFRLRAKTSLVTRHGERQRVLRPGERVSQKKRTGRSQNRSLFEMRRDGRS